MNNKYIIWCDDSRKIIGKLQLFHSHLVETMNVSQSEILFVTLYESFSRYLVNKFNIQSISIESIQSTFFDNHSPFYSFDLASFDNSIQQSIILSFLSVNSYKKPPFFGQLKSCNTDDPVYGLSIYLSLWNQLINTNPTAHYFVLNGMSYPSFALSFLLALKKMQHTFWENGLLKSSLIFDDIGVNAYSSLQLYNSNGSIKAAKSVFNSLSHIIDSLMGSQHDIRSILVTYQYEYDTNIKCSSPFYNKNIFSRFLYNSLSSEHQSILCKRDHPKNKRSNRLITSLKSHLLKHKTIDSVINSSDLLITINSTTGLESILSNKPTILLGSSYYSVFLRVVYIAYQSFEIPVYVFNPNIDSERRLSILECLSSVSFVCDLKLGLSEVSNFSIQDFINKSTHNNFLNSFPMTPFVSPKILH
ncbi:capsule polysaccharide biosynthesis family protein [Synechococcus sp. RS9915]|nr:capsule polysaccharide biosynthesis family protein [Synechococcus sp. RS9915]